MGKMVRGMQSTGLAITPNKELRMQPTNDVHIKEENGKYYLRYRSGGISIDGLLLKAIPPDMKSAIKEKWEIVEKYANNKGYMGPNTTVVQLWCKYLQYERERAHAGKISEKTFLEKMMIMQLYLVTFFGTYKPQEITKSEWLKYTRSECVSTIKNFQNHRKVLVNFLTWCHDPENGGYVNYLPKFELPEHDARESLVLTDTEIETIHEAITNPDLKDLWKLLALTGCRKMEIQGLAWDRVDFANKRYLTKSGKSKTKTPRWLPMSNEVMIILQRRSSNNSKWVFPDLANPHRPYVDCHFKNQLPIAVAVAKARPGITFKDLRTTFANKVLNLNVDRDDAAKFMGHSVDIQKGYYDKTQDEARKRVVETLDNQPKARPVLSVVR